MSTGKAILVTLGLGILIVATAAFGVGILIFLATVVWVAVDSKKFELHKYKSMISTTPVSLAFGCLLLWIVVFPMYLIEKGKILDGTAELKEEYRGSGGTGVSTGSEGSAGRSAPGNTDAGSDTQGSYV